MSLDGVHGPEGGEAVPVHRLAGPRGARALRPLPPVHPPDPHDEPRRLRAHRHSLQVPGPIKFFNSLSALTLKASLLSATSLRRVLFISILIISQPFFSHSHPYSLSFHVLLTF